MKLEGIIDKKNIDYSKNAFVAFNLFEEPRDVCQNIEKVQDWLITDFDHYLKGNDHV